MNAAQGGIAACGSDAMPEQVPIAEDGDPVAEALSAAQAPPAVAVETSSSDIVESSPVHGMLQRRRRHASLPVCPRKESPIVRARHLWQQLVERMEAEWALITLRQGSCSLLLRQGRVYVSSSTAACHLSAHRHKDSHNAACQSPFLLGVACTNLLYCVHS